MANQFSINIRGIDEVVAALDAMPRRLVKNAYARALAAASVPIVDALLAQTPEHSGNLKAHLVTDIGIEANGKGGTLQIGFGRQGFVARMLEFGHRQVGHKPKLKESGVVAARPFMRPALETSAEAAIDAFAESIQDSLDGGLK